MATRTAAALPVRVECASKSFGRRRLWTDVSFDVHGGQMIALAGPSGSGKTTLLNCIGMLEKLDSGKLSYGGHDATRVGAATRRRLYRDAIGFLFQNSGLVDNWSVRENLRIALDRRRIPRSDQHRRLDDALEQMGLSGFADDAVHTLSGGEQQRVGLARLLLKEASVVFADEPTASLDHGNADIVVAALRHLADRGAAVVISTHDDQVVAASDGVVQLVGESRELGSVARLRWRGDGAL